MVLFPVEVEMSMADELQAQKDLSAPETVDLPPAVEAEGRESHSEKVASPPWLAPAALVGAGLFLYSVRGILAPFVVAAALAYVFSPAVGCIERRVRIPRVLAVSAFFLVVLAPLAALVWVVEPTLVRETRELATNTPDILRNLLVQLFGDERVEILGQRVDANSATNYLLGSLRSLLGTPVGAIHVVATAAEAVLHAILSLVLLFYFLVDQKRFARVALRLIPVEHRDEWQKVAVEIHLVLARYVRGLLFLVGLMATVTWVGLTFIFHLRYALPIAIATGFLEIIPFLGPVVAATLAAVVGLFQGGPNLAVGIALFYLVVRQLEDQLVMPLVVGKAVEIHPAVAIFAVLSGGTVAGVLGALLGIPVAAAIKVAFDRWRPA